MPDKEFVLSNEHERWNKGEFSHYERLCEMFASEMKEDKMVNCLLLIVSRINMGLDC